MSKKKDNTNDMIKEESSAAYEMSNNTYTYEDYLNFDDGKRYEIIDGVLFELSAPSTIHQMITLEIASQLNLQLKGKKCTPLIWPCDVILDNKSNRKKSKIIIQPDVMVVCDKNKIEDKGVFGSPDLVIEVISPSTFRRDKLEKFNLYLKYGIREYWLVYPKEQTIEVNVLENNKYVTYNYSILDKIDLKISQDNKVTICLKNFYEQLEIEVKES